MSGSGAGAAIGPYVVVSELGRGGMGLVLRARHAVTEAEVALKVLDDSLVGAEAAARFDLEGKALARVAGDGIVPVHAAGVAGRQRWIALGLMVGGSLRDRMKTSGAWPWEQAVELVRGLAATLARCHAAGIVHRDLKPENILFDDAGRAHVADFGLVRDLAAQALTLSGTIMGTPAYMAPEQLEGLRADARADVWALAVMLHELVAGERPWLGKQTVQLLGRITATPRPRLAERGAPAELDAVLDQALTLDVDTRYPDAGALAAELGRVLAREAPAVHLAALARRRRRRQLGLLALAALVALLGAALQRVGERRARLLALTRALDEGAAAIDSWRDGLRATRCAGEAPDPARQAALEAALQAGEERLQDPATEGAALAAARARIAAARGRLALAVDRGRATEARAAGTALGGLSVPLGEDAHLRLLAELAAPAPNLAAVKRELGLVLNEVPRATGAEGVDLRLAAARGHAALGQLPDAVALLGRGQTPVELRLRARCAGLMSGDPAELARLTFDRVAPTAPGGEELGAAALDGFLTRLAGSAEADLRRLVRLAWEFELDYRERWRKLDPAAARPWPGPDQWSVARPPERPARPPRTLLRPGHAPALRAALERLEGSVDDASAPVAALCSELLSVADPTAPPPARTWARVHALFERHAGELERLEGGARAGMARLICVDLAHRLRLGLPTNAGAIPDLLRTPLRRAANELAAEDDRDWAREALLCALELHNRRNFFDLLQGQETREPERATLRRPLERLAASPLLSPAARAAVALEVAEYGLAHVGDIDQPRWLEAPTSPERRARLEEARALLEAHRSTSSTPDQVDCLLAQVVFVLGDAAEAERLARRSLALCELRDRGEPLEGRLVAPKTAFQYAPVTARRLLIRALRAQGRTAEAEALAATDDTARPR